MPNSYPRIDAQHLIQHVKATRTSSENQPLSSLIPETYYILEMALELALSDLDYRQDTNTARACWLLAGLAMQFEPHRREV